MGKTTVKRDGQGAHNGVGLSAQPRRKVVEWQVDLIEEVRAGVEDRRRPRTREESRCDVRTGRSMTTTKPQRAVTDAFRWLSVSGVLSPRALRSTLLRRQATRLLYEE
jgi:hypothetical protein